MLDYKAQQRIADLNNYLAKQSKPPKPKQGSEFGGAVMGFGKESMNPVRAIRDFGVGVYEGGKQMGEGITDLIDRGLGTNIDYNPVLDPKVSDSSFGNLGRGVGQVGVGLAGAGAAAVGMAFGAPAAVVGGVAAGGAALTAASGIGQNLNEVENRAFQQGREPTTREMAVGAGIGATEGLLPYGAGKIIQRTGIGKRITRPILAGALAEGAQEAGVEVAHALNVGDPVSLDQAATAGLYGGAVGAGAGAATKYLTPPPPAPPAPPPRVSQPHGPPPPPPNTPPPVDPNHRRDFVDVPGVEGRGTTLAGHGGTVVPDPNSYPAVIPRVPQPHGPAPREPLGPPIPLVPQPHGPPGPQDQAIPGGVMQGKRKALPAPPPGTLTEPPAGPANPSAGSPKPPIIDPDKVEREGETRGKEGQKMPGFKMKTHEIDVDPTTVKVDAARFQTRTGDKNADGTTDRLRDSKKWFDTVADPILIYEKKDGTRTVVDGHHRMALWRKAKQEGTKPPATIRARVLMQRDGWTEDKAKQAAADVNIFKGTVDSPMDIATALRGQSKLDIAAKHYPKSNRAGWGTGRDLANLSDEAWKIMLEKGEGKGVDGSIPHNYAAQVGAYTKDKAKHAEALNTMLRDMPETLEHARTIAQLMNEANATQADPDSAIDPLFPKDGMTTNMQTRIDLIVATKKVLRSLRQLGKTAERHGDAIEEQDIGRIDKGGAGNLAYQSGSAYDAFAVDAVRSGTNMSAAVTKEVEAMGDNPSKKDISDAAHRLAAMWNPKGDGQKKNTKPVAPSVTEQIRAKIPKKLAEADEQELAALKSRLQSISAGLAGTRMGMQYTDAEGKKQRQAKIRELEAEGREVEAKIKAIKERNAPPEPATPAKPVGATNIWEDQTTDTDPDPEPDPEPAKPKGAAIPDDFGIEENTEPTLLSTPEASKPEPTSDSDAEQRIRDELARQEERMNGKGNQKDVEGTALFGEHGQMDIAEEARNAELRDQGKASKTEMDEAAQAKEKKRRKDLNMAQTNYMRLLGQHTRDVNLRNGATSAPFWTKIINELDTWAKIIESLGGSVGRGHMMSATRPSMPADKRVERFLKRLRDKDVSPESIKYMARFLKRFGDSIPYQLDEDEGGGVGREKVGGSYHPDYSALFVNATAGHPTPIDSVLAHEMGHFIFYELMSHQDRIDFLKTAKEYYKNRPDRFDKEKFDGSNAGVDIQELFAYNFQKFYMNKMEKGASDYAYWKRVVPNYIQRVYDWFTGSGNPNTIFDPIFDRMVNAAPSIRPTPNPSMSGTSLSESLMDFDPDSKDVFTDSDFQQVLRGEARHLGAPVHMMQDVAGVKVGNDKDGNPKAVKIGTQAEGDVMGLATTTSDMSSHWRDALLAVGQVAGHRLMNKGMAKALDGNHFHHWLLRHVTDNTPPKISDAVLGAMPMKARKAIGRMRGQAQLKPGFNIQSMLNAMPYKTKQGIRQWFETTNQRVNHMASNAIGRLTDETAVANFKGAIGSFLRANSLTQAIYNRGVPRRKQDKGIWENAPPGKDAVSLDDVTNGLDPATREALGRYMNDQGRRGQGQVQSRIDRIEAVVDAINGKIADGQATPLHHNILKQAEAALEKLYTRLAEHIDTMDAIKDEEGVNGAELEKRALLMEKFMTQLGDYAVSTGVIPKEAMAAMRTRDPFYVPQQRPRYTSPRSFKEYHGAAEGAVDFILPTMNYIHFIAKQAELNTMLDQIKSIGDGSVIRVSQKVVQKAVGRDKMNQSIVFADSDTNKEGRAQRSGQVYMRVMVWRTDDEGKPFLNPEWYSVSDPFLVDMLNQFNLGTGADPTMLRVFGWFSTLIRSVLSASPNFIANQAVKDPLEAQFVADTTKGGLLLPKPAAAFDRMWRVNISGRLDDSTYIAMTNGIINTGRDLQAMMSEDSVAHRSLAGYVASNIPDSAIRRAISKTTGRYEQALNMVHFTDQMSRISAFDKEKKAGKTNREAAVTATEIHDFAMHGTGKYTALFRSLIPYSQSWMRGIARGKEVVVDETIMRDGKLAMKGDQDALKRLGTKIGYVALLSVAFAAWEDELDENHPQYKTFSEADRARAGVNLFVPTDEGKAYLEKHGLTKFPKNMPLAQRTKFEKHIYIPVGHEVGKLAKIVSLAMRKNEDKKLGAAWQIMKDYVAPPHTIPVLGAVDAMFGDNIQHKNRGLPVDQQVGKSKSATAIGQATGIPPDRLEVAIEDLLPGLGPAVLHLADSMQGHATKTAGTGFFPTFIRSNRMHTELTERFWKNGNQIQADDNALKAYTTRLAQGESREAIIADIGPEQWNNVVIGHQNAAISGAIRQRQEASNVLNNKISAKDASAASLKEHVLNLGRIAYIGIDGTEHNLLRASDADGWKKSGMFEHISSIAKKNLNETQRKNAYRAAAAELTTLIRRGNYGLYMAWRDRTLKQLEAKK